MSSGNRDCRGSAINGSGVGSDANSFTREYIVGVLKCFKDIEPGRAKAPSQEQSAGNEYLEACDVPFRQAWWLGWGGSSERRKVVNGEEHWVCVGLLGQPTNRAWVLLE